MQLNISNFKVHTWIRSTQLLTVLKKKGKKTRNFYIIQQRFHYMIYPNGATNITKIQDLEQQKDEILRELTELFNPCLIETFHTDNISASTKWKQQIDLRKIAEFKNLTKYLACTGNCENVKHFCNTRLNYKFVPERFPGLFLYFSHLTVILFTSGAIVFVGAKNKNYLEDCNRKLEEILKNV